MRRVFAEGRAQLCAGVSLQVERERAQAAAEAERRAREEALAMERALRAERRAQEEALEMELALRAAEAEELARAEARLLVNEMYVCIILLDANARAGQEMRVACGIGEAVSGCLCVRFPSGVNAHARCSRESTNGRSARDWRRR